MTIRLTVNTSGIVAKLKTKAEAIQHARRKSLLESAFLIRARAVMKAPGDQGQLRSSITAAIASSLKTGRDIGVVYASAKHAMYMETGTRPGHGPNAGQPRSGPPEGSLLGWMMRVLGMGEEEAKKKEMGLRLAIKAKGTKPHPFMRPALEESRADVREIFRRNLLQAVRG